MKNNTTSKIMSHWSSNNLYNITHTIKKTPWIFNMIQCQRSLFSRDTKLDQLTLKTVATKLTKSHHLKIKPSLAIHQM